MQNRTIAGTIGMVLGRIGIALLTALLIILLGLFVIIWVFEKGPSPTAQRMFVMSVNETSAIKWVANIFLSDTEVEQILSINQEEDEESPGTDVSLISIRPPGPPPVLSAASGSEYAVSQPADSGYGYDVDDSYDGIDLVRITGKGYTGCMLIIEDPLRVFVGTLDYYGENVKGLLLKRMAEKHGAVAGINGGGFFDFDSEGIGGLPRGLVVADGEVVWSSGSGTFIGFDADGILHVGSISSQTAKNLGIQWGCSFGPVLIKNGVASSDSVLKSGVNPRTAIGQRADGAVLMLVVDGRQLNSLGATYEDLVEIFFDFGAVTAANLDGGSSTAMYLNGEIVNSRSTAHGRLLPTAFLVRPSDFG